MVNNSKKAVFKARNFADGTTIHREGKTQFWAESGTIPGQSFIVSENTSALLLLCLELDMVAQRVEGLVDVVEKDSYLETFNDVISEAKDIIIGEFVKDRIEAGIGMNPGKETITI